MVYADDSNLLRSRQAASITWAKYLSASGMPYLPFLENTMYYWALTTNSKMSTHAISRRLKPYNFLRELNKISQLHWNILLKLWLIFYCHEQKIQKMSHFWHLNDHNSRSKHDKWTKDPICLIYSEISSLVYFISAFQKPQILIQWGPSSVKYTFTC